MLPSGSLKNAWWQALLSMPQSATSLSACACSRDGLSCALRPRAIRPARSSTLRCFDAAWTVIGNGSASSLTVASPCASRARIARRVGSAGAWKVALKRSAVAVLIRLAVELLG